MKKQRIYTALGIALALALAFGGLAVTEGLLTQKENALLTVRGSIPLTVSEDSNSAHNPTTAPGNVSSEPSDVGNSSNTSEPPVTITNNFPKLTASEMYEVLVGWALPGTQSPHEPVAGQLSMEQAIIAAEEWLAYFCQAGLVPATAREFDKTNAYLALNEVSTNQTPEIIATNPLVNFDEIRDKALLEPFYSYWTVSFSGGDLETALVINAGTGQIWQAEMVSQNADINFDNISEDKLLTAFINYIDADGADGIININAEITSVILDGKTVSAKAELSLSVIRP